MAIFSRADRQALAVIVIIAIAAPSSANAQYYDYGDAHMNAENVITTVSKNVVTAFNDGVAQIIEAIRMSTAQITTAINRQTQAYAQIQANQTDQLVAAVRNDAKREAVVNQSVSPAACKAITASSGIMAAAAGSAQVAQRLGAANAAWNVGVAGSPSGDGTTAAVSWTVDQHYKKFCLPGEVGCTPGRVPGGDILGSSLFSGPRTLNQDELEAAQAYVRNLTNPIPRGPVPAEWRKTPDGQAAIADRNAEIARTSLAQAILDWIISLYTPSTNLGAWAKTALPPGTIKTNQDAISWMQLLDADVGRRYGKPEWFLQLQEMPPAAVEREAVYLAAMNGFLQWNILQELQKSNAVNAVSMANTTKGTGTVTSTTGTKAPPALPPQGRGS